MAEIVQLAQEANRRSMIENRRWDGALIVGPAVIAPIESVTISDSAFDAHPDAIFIEIPPDRFVVGVIGLRNVTFNDCQFQNIGIIGPSTAIAAMRAGMGVPQDEPSPVPAGASGVTPAGGSVTA